MASLNNRSSSRQSAVDAGEEELAVSSRRSETLPTHKEGSEKQKLPPVFHVNPAGESGRSGVDLIPFLKICVRSTCVVSMVVNILWPFVIPAIVIHFARPDLHVWTFALNYIAMVPTANLLGFAGGELSKKLPKVPGILLETTLSSVVEIVLMMTLITNSSPSNNLVPVIQAAILGSILANLLFCLGMCFYAGGMRRDEQVFHAAVSEVGSGLLLVAGFGLLIPSAYYSALSGSTNGNTFTLDQLLANTRTISRATSVILLIAFLT
ncbi:hypothetical protein Plec18167_008930 [Paecilomyces lecythidis]|uniref:Sodium/calcium exchanger membrane region domain-containing protein n=1 Tax=Paecilomyces lecythidis TaxID=3004212 RepID=A0ABR3WSZ4_9EURO